MSDGVDPHISVSGRFAALIVWGEAACWMLVDGGVYGAADDRRAGRQQAVGVDRHSTDWPNGRVIVDCIITGDLLRPLIGRGRTLANQTANIRWLYELLRPPLEKVTGKAPRLLCDAKGFDFAAVWSALDLESTYENWARLYEGGPDAEQAVTLLAARLDADIVIAFEPSPLIAAAVALAGAILIAIEIHPFRFGRDLLFGVCTSAEPQHARMAAAIDLASRLETDSAILRARCSRGPAISGPDGRALAVLLQDPWDSSVIENGSFWTSEALFKAVGSIAEGFDTILLRPHPHTPQVAATDLRRLASLTGRPVRATAAHAYRLMTDPAIGAVAAISSGALDEAQFFGKPVLRFAKRRRPLADWREPTKSKPGSLLPVDASLFSPQFWHRALSGGASASASSGPPPGFEEIGQAGFIRSSIGEDWGLRELSSDTRSRWHDPAERAWRAWLATAALIFIAAIGAAAKLFFRHSTH